MRVEVVSLHKDGSIVVVRIRRLFRKTVTMTFVREVCSEPLKHGVSGWWLALPSMRFMPRLNWRIDVAIAEMHRAIHLSSLREDAMNAIGISDGDSFAG